jgi:hypothetical protein
MAEEKDANKETIMANVAEFQTTLNAIIKDRSCSDKNPFIHNLTNLIYYHIPDYEYLFKYYLLKETVEQILRSPTGEPLLENLRKKENITGILQAEFTKRSSIFTNPTSDAEKNPKILWYICEIFHNFRVKTDPDELNMLFKTTFSETAPAIVNNNNNNNQTISPTGGTPKDEAEIEDELCFINSKKEREVEQKLLTNNVSKEQILADVDSIINTHVNRVSKYLFIQSKKYSKKQEKRTIHKILHNYEYEYTEDVDDEPTKKDNTATQEEKNPPQPTNSLNEIIKTSIIQMLHKPNTSIKIIIIQNIKTYLIGIVKTIISAVKSRANSKYSFCMLLLALLQDSTIKGYINRIGSSADYLYYIREYKKLRYKIDLFNKQNTKNNTTATYLDYNELEVPAFCLCGFIYHYLSTHPTIKPPPFINVEGLANKLEHANYSLMNSIKTRMFDRIQRYKDFVLSTVPSTFYPQKDRGGARTIPKMPAFPKTPFGKKQAKTNEISEQVISEAITEEAPVPSKFSKYSPINESTKTTTGKYILSIMGVVQNEINNMNFSDSIKIRLNADADDLRSTLLYCIIELVDNTFSDFLNRLFENDMLDVQPIPTPDPPPVSAKIPSKEMVISNTLYRLFFLKMVKDMNSNENKVSEEILRRAIQMVSDINTGTYNAPNIKNNTTDIARTLLFMRKQKGGGRTRRRYTKKRRHTKSRKSKKIRVSMNNRRRSTVHGYTNISSDTRKNQYRGRDRFTRKK